MLNPNPGPVDPSMQVDDPTLDVSTPDQVQEHLGILKDRYDQMIKQKNLGYKKLDILRKDILNSFIKTMRDKGFDVSTPEGMMQYIQQLEQVDPDMAEVLIWALGRFMPDQHEQMHTEGSALPGLPELEMPSMGMEEPSMETGMNSQPEDQIGQPESPPEV